MFVDTGAWIGLFSARDQRHYEATQLVRDAIRERVSFVTTNLVVAETHRILLFSGGARVALAALMRIEKTQDVLIEFATSDHHRAAKAWLEKLGGQPVSYTDAVSFAVMESTRCGSVLTFNGDFETAGFARWGG